MKPYAIFPAMLFLFTLLTYAAQPPFESRVMPISHNQRKIMQKYTWKPNCPASLNQLAEIRLSYWGFDHHAHQGVLIVNKVLAQQVVRIFKALYDHQFPIARMETMDHFDGNDTAAMNANDTSAFNCRTRIGQSSGFSQHSYGRAIDINPLINPYVKGNIVLPATAKKYVNRTQPYPGKITKNSFIYREFAKYGWRWGGDWRFAKDYQHFEKKA